MTVFCKCCARAKYAEQINKYEPLLKKFDSLKTLYAQAMLMPDVALMISDAKMKADQYRLILKPVYDAIDSAQECGTEPCECGRCG